MFVNSSSDANTFCSLVTEWSFVKKKAICSFLLRSCGVCEEKYDYRANLLRAVTG